MVSAVQTSSIVFYAATAGLALVSLAVFFCALCGKKRSRRGVDVLWIVLGVLLSLIALATGAFAVIRAYAPLGLSVQDNAGKLAFSYNGSQIFAVPYIGKAVSIFAALKVVGVAAPFAVAGICLLSVIVLGVKTRRKKKAKKAPPQENIIAFDRDAEPQAEQTEPYAEPVREEPRVEAEETDTRDMPEALDREAAHSIVDEIDKLVTGDDSRADSVEIDAALERAILEGYAMLDGEKDAYASEPFEDSDETEEASEDTGADEPVQESDATEETAESEEETNTQEEIISEEETKSEEEIQSETTESEEEFESDGDTEADAKEETWAYEEEFGDTEEQNSEDLPETPEIVPESHRARAERYAAKTVIDVDSDRVFEERPVRRFEFSESSVPARVRTIIRRPTAHNVAEIEKRAREKQAEDAAGKANKQASETKSGKSVAAQNKQTSAHKPTAAQDKQTPPRKSAAKPVEKAVTAEENNLPLTRKYIILNRRNAAALFNDYLNSKRESEKEELTESLNTIIMK